MLGHTTRRLVDERAGEIHKLLWPHAQLFQVPIETLRQNVDCLVALGHDTTVTQLGFRFVSLAGPARKLCE